MSIREINSEVITQTVCALFMDAAVFLPADVRNAIENAKNKEMSAHAKQILEILAENCRYAEESGIPICQDTGMAVVFIELGQDVHISGDNLEDAVNKGVRQGYERGYLRKSVVADPLNRVNTGDNTPAVIHVRIVPGDKIRITAMPKGFGSENMSAVRMFTPSASDEEIADFVVETVVRAGGMPCPPVVIGVGIGGTAEKACLLAKQALIRDLTESNENPAYAQLEEKILRRVNLTGLGPQGMGGRVTALAVLIEYFPTHIAGLPVAVNISCHACRHKTAVI